MYGGHGTAGVVERLRQADGYKRTVPARIGWFHIIVVSNTNHMAMVTA